MNADERVTIEEGVVVGTAPDRDGQGPGRDLRADVYHPPVALGDPPPAGWPAILLVHGGAWHSGDRSQLRGYGILLARAGWLVVACEYRLSPEARWPEHIHDVKTALRWMRANRDLGIDLDRLVISGNSAGGHLALVAAGTPDEPALEGTGGHAGAGTAVAACVAIYPPTRLYSAGVGSPDGRIVNMITDQPSEEVARQASPVDWAGPEFPPTLLIHGGADEVVPVRHSELMYQALRDAGVPVDLHIYADQPHAFDAASDYGRRTAAEILFFLDRYVPARTPTATAR